MVSEFKQNPPRRRIQVTGKGPLPPEPEKHALSISKAQLACGCSQNLLAQEHKGPPPSSVKTRVKGESHAPSHQQMMPWKDPGNQ